jgi:outer membrane lipoprotein-sorting protein
MKNFVIYIFLLFFFIAPGSAQDSKQARAMLDKIAKTVGRSGGASASFSMNNGSGNVSGTVYIKGNRFHARTAEAIVWYNGKSQWTYLKKNNEVNISNPTQAQQQMMNPYTFINLYKLGYNLSMKPQGNNQEIHLVAQDKKRGIQELYITANKKTCIPTVVKMKHKQKWTTITIRNFSAKNVSDGIFTFKSKDYPSAEVIDLR